MRFHPHLKFFRGSCGIRVCELSCFYNRRFIRHRTFGRLQRIHGLRRLLRDCGVPFGRLRSFRGLRRLLRDCGISFGRLRSFRGLRRLLRDYGVPFGRLRSFRGLCRLLRDCGRCFGLLLLLRELRRLLRIREKFCSLQRFRGFHRLCQEIGQIAFWFDRLLGLRRQPADNIGLRPFACCCSRSIGQI